jgi:hypothetical protein
MRPFDRERGALNLRTLALALDGSADGAVEPGRIRAVDGDLMG